MSKPSRPVYITKMSLKHIKNDNEPLDQKKLSEAAEKMRRILNDPNQSRPVMEVYYEIEL